LKFETKDPENAKQLIRIFETRETILITSNPPKTLDTYLGALVRETRAQQWADQAKYTAFRKCFERLWSAAVFDLALESKFPGRVLIVLKKDYFYV
jgi:hypothetical protein